MRAGAQLAGPRRLVLRRIMEHAEVGDVAVDLVVEIVLVHAEPHREDPHQGRGQLFHAAVVGAPGLAELRQPVGPHVGREEIRRRRGAMIGVVRRIDRTDREGLLEIGRRLLVEAVGQRLVAEGDEAAIAVGRHAVAQLVLERALEEGSRHAPHVVDQRGRDAVPRDEQETHIRAGGVHGLCHRAPVGVAAVQERRDVDQGNGAGHGLSQANTMPVPFYSTIARNRKAANITRWTMPCSTVVRPVPRVTTPMNKVSASSSCSLMPRPSYSRCTEDDRHRGHRRDRETDAGQGRTTITRRRAIERPPKRSCTRSPGAIC